MWGDVGVVAVLGGVAGCYDECAVGEVVSVGADSVFFRLVGDVFFKCVFYVGHSTAPFVVGETVADGCVESCAECAEEWASVDRAVVAGEGVVGGYDGESSAKVEWYAAVSCEAVSGAGGDDAEGNAGVAKGSCCFVDSAVAAGGDD